ncbi:MAG: thiamine pyrophosphate-dependent dehydrogenase E1 component subunit alpha [Nanoarchaeota archaeon]|nr:thiamine pyrophosphate-dependent dehydrogenase E1 component subunit alpha [Nanoarchaeota archaeon]
MKAVSKKIAIELYKKVYLIRSAERGIINNYKRNVMKSPMHMSMGEEAIIAGVCQALRRQDQALGTYRSHGLYLAKTGETDGFFAEMYGKASGNAGGKAGSMFLSRPSAGLVGVSAVVATTIPVAAGVAYANKVKRNGKITTVFFGDGAIEEGAFWESLNFACLKKVPLLFVCEDNGFAIHAGEAARHGYKSIADIVGKFESNVFTSSSTDPEVIFEIATKAINMIKKTKKPSFLHLKYYRYLEHVGVGEDFAVGYRPKSEFKKWMKADPMKLMRGNLLKKGIREEAIMQLEKIIDKKVERSISLAENAPDPAKSELYKNVFYEKG